MIRGGRPIKNAVSVAAWSSWWKVCGSVLRKLIVWLAVICDGADMIVHNSLLYFPILNRLLLQ